MKGDHSRPAGTSLSPLALAACIDKQHLQYGSPDSLLLSPHPFSSIMAAKSMHQGGATASSECQSKALRYSRSAQTSPVETATLLRISHLYHKHKFWRSPDVGQWIADDSHGGHSIAGMVPSPAMQTCGHGASLLFQHDSIVLLLG